jgi:hypothetical protein
LNIISHSLSHFPERKFAVNSENNNAEEWRAIEFRVSHF